jgi:hypothetical protein
MNTAVQALKDNVAERKDFGGSMPVAIASNPLATAREAEAKAAVEARYIMAMRRPRNWDEVRQKILKECRRPAFAKDKSTLYRKPVGNGVEGLGIRFAEMALRCLTNVMTETPVIYEDDMRRVIRVIVTNLEDNQTEFADVTVSKTVERSKPMDDGTYISVRMNSYNKPVYTVPATDEDLLNKEWALVSKMRRNCGLRHIPGDIQAEAEAIIRSVRLDEAARDPDAERREIADGFAKLNVPVDELTEYVGHDLATCSPKELADLRTVWGSVRDGEATWASLLEHSRAARAAERANAGQAGDKTKARGVAAVKDRAKKAAEPKDGKKDKITGTVEQRDAFIAKFAQCQDTEILSVVMDETRLISWTAPDEATIKAAYQKRLGELGG